ncbi:MAG: TlpA disulfide reductase family protein [Bacteroidota bacterium]
MKYLASLTLLLSLAALHLSAQEQDSSNLLKVSDDMPEFTLKTLDGNTVSSDDLYGKVVLINFFATWCPPCNLELPLLEKDIWAKYKDDENFVLLVIDREEPADKVAPFVKKKKFTMPFYLDPKREVYGLFATKFIPRNYLFDKEGRLMLCSKGFSKEDFDVLLKELGALLKK